MDGPVGGLAITELIAFQQMNGQQLRHPVQAGVQRGLDGLADGFVGKSGGQGIDGQDAVGSETGLVQRLKGGIPHPGACQAAVQRPIEQVALAVVQALGGEALVEKGQPEAAGLVGHGDMGDVETLADVGSPGL